jgi:hypothetical protein
MLDADQTEFHIETWGNISGDNIKEHSWILFNKIEYVDNVDREAKYFRKERIPPQHKDTITFLIPKMLFHNFIGDLAIEQINLKFEVKTASTQLTINVVQDLTWDGETYSAANGEKMCHADQDKPCTITIQ